MEVSFFTHQSKTVDFITIYVQISMSGVQLQIGSTGVKIPNSDWDSKKREIRESNPQCMALNETLQRWKTRLIKIFNDLSDKDQSFSAQDVKTLFKQKYQAATKKPPTLLDRYSDFREEVKAIADKADEKGLPRPRGTADNTQYTYRTVFWNLRRFLIANKMPGLKPMDFDEDHYETFQDWLASGGFKRSSIRLHCIRLKTVFKWMKKRKFINLNPLDGLPIPPDEENPPKSITESEYQALVTHRFRNSNMQRAADLFVVYCRTGFHFSDLQDLIADASTGAWTTHWDREGMEWIFWNRNKTEELAKVPIFPEVRQILEKYGNWGELPRFSNTKLNQWLKLIAAELGLREDLCVTSGRDTMTDWLYNECLATDETVKVILGRKDGRGLRRYGSADERRVKKELKLA
jgi:hypothetical protein